MSRYEAMTPELMYLYDEAFKRVCAEDSLCDQPMFTVYSEMSAMKVIQRSAAKRLDLPELSVENAMKEMINNKPVHEQGVF
jgi:hypothetical protein